MIVPAEKFQTECSTFRTGGCIWSEAADSGFKDGKQTKATSVVFDSLILWFHSRTWSPVVHIWMCSSTCVLFFEADCFSLGRSQHTVLPVTSRNEAVPPPFQASPPKQSQLTMTTHRFPHHQACSPVPLRNAIQVTLRWPAAQPLFTTSFWNWINMKNSYYDLRGHLTVPHRRSGQAHHSVDAPMEKMELNCCHHKLFCGRR